MVDVDEDADVLDVDDGDDIDDDDNELYICFMVFTIDLGFIGVDAGTFGITRIVDGDVVDMIADERFNVGI
jgi:hypothetical protein